MTDFWVTFLSGLASGIVLLMLATFVRNLVRRRSQGEPVLKLDIRESRPLIPIVMGLILVILGLFVRQVVDDPLP